MQNTLPILMYHSITAVKKEEVMRSLHVHPKAFNRQMLLLKNLGYKATSVFDALQIKHNWPQEKIIALSFDDGYENFHSNALPILQRYNFSATIFVISNKIGGINDWDTSKGISPNALMTEDQIKSCVSYGIELGSHCQNHTQLTELNPLQIKTEIINSKAILQDTFDVQVRGLCYPYGDYDKSCEVYANEGGYTYATTMQRGKQSLPDANIFALKRIPITWHTSIVQFWIKLFTNYENKKG